MWTIHNLGDHDAPYETLCASERPYLLTTDPPVQLAEGHSARGIAEGKDKASVNA